eukprot:2804407-Rhodomonas_salina.2
MSTAHRIAAYAMAVPDIAKHAHRAIGEATGGALKAGGSDCTGSTIRYVSTAQSIAEYAITVL